MYIGMQLVGLDGWMVEKVGPGGDAGDGSAGVHNHLGNYWIAQRLTYDIYWKMDRAPSQSWLAAVTARLAHHMERNRWVLCMYIAKYYI